MLKKYLNLHFHYLEKFIFKSITLFDGYIFSVLANIYFTLLFRDVKFIFEGGLYKVSQKGITRYFENKKQAINVYNRGLQFRANSIGSIYFLDKMKFKENDLIIDCGANVGDLSLYFQFNKFTVRYFGFEPSLKEFSCLQLNEGESNCVNKGLWNEDTTLEFYVSSDGADSSLIEPPFYSNIVSVDVVRLDSIFNERVKLLKIEAEGAEPEVLMGAEKLLKNVEFVTADLGFERGLSQESTLIPVINFMLNQNFELLEVSHRRVCALFKNKLYN